MIEISKQKGLQFKDNRSRVVAEENGRSYCANNPEKKEIYLYKIDGGVITSGRRCDFALGVTKDKVINLIELKGCDVKHAAEQISATIDALAEHLNGHTVNGKIVLSRVSRPDIKSSSIRDLEKKLAARKGKLSKASRSMEESI